MVIYFLSLSKNTYKMKVIVSTSDKYEDVLKVYCFLFNKFWSKNQEVEVVGYKKPSFELPPNFTFYSMGEDRGTKFWSDDLKEYFEQLDEKFFIYTMEDNFLTSQTDIEAITKIETILHNKVGRVDLTDVFTTMSEGVIQPHSLYKEVDGLKIYVRGQNAKWRASFPLSIWSKEYLLRVLEKPNMTPWDVENYGNVISRGDGYDILGTHHTEKVISPRNEGVSTFNDGSGLFRYRLHGIDPKVIKEMEDKDILPKHIEKLV